MTTPIKRRYSLRGTCRVFIFIKMFLLICACAAPLTQPASKVASEGYYYHERLTVDSWQITFRSYEPSSETLDYALAYAAELTTSLEYDWFEVPEREIGNASAVLTIRFGKGVMPDVPNLYEARSRLNVRGDLND